MAEENLPALWVACKKKKRVEMSCWFIEGASDYLFKTDVECVRKKALQPEGKNQDGTLETVSSQQVLIRYKGKTRWRLFLKAVKNVTRW